MDKINKYKNMIEKKHLIQGVTSVASIYGIYKSYQYMKNYQEESDNESDNESDIEFDSESESESIVNLSIVFKYGRGVARIPLVWCSSVHHVALSRRRPGFKSRHEHQNIS